jgi:hypothetical protein
MERVGDQALADAGPALDEDPWLAPACPLAIEQPAELLPNPSMVERSPSSSAGASMTRVWLL